MKRLLWIIIALLVTMNSESRTRHVHLKWIHTSDVHGALFGYNYLTHKAVEGGLAATYSYCQELRKSLHDNLILTDGGDVLQGQPSVYYYNFMDTTSTHLVASCMNECGYVAGVMGNHDIETGHSVYDRWMEDVNFPILGANIIDRNTGQPYLKPYTTIIRDGVKIAILGMVTPAIPNWLPENLWSGLEFEDIVTSARHWVKVIQEKEHPDLLIGLFHSGLNGGITTTEYRENSTEKVAAEVPGFDIIFYGHDHQPHVAYVRNSSGDSCLVAGPTNAGRSVCEADIYLEMSKSKVKSKKISGKISSINHSQTPEAMLFEAKFADQRQEVEQWINQKIGKLTLPLMERDAFFGSSAFIDLIHQMQLDITGADISITSPLSFDSRLDSGEVRISDMFSLYKYENMLYTMLMTGREVKGLLEMSYGMWTNQMTLPEDHIMLLDNDLSNVRRHGFKNPTFNMDSAAGIIYKVDVTKPIGERVNITSMADDTSFNLDSTYRVAVNSYRGNGGGELMTKGAGIPHEELKSRIVASTDKDLRYYLIKRIKEKQVIIPAPLNQWRFVPKEWAEPAIVRDKKLLFPH